MHRNVPFQPRVNCYVTSNLVAVAVAGARSFAVGHRRRYLCGPCWCCIVVYINTSAGFWIHMQMSRVSMCSWGCVCDHVRLGGRRPREKKKKKKVVSLRKDQNERNKKRKEEEIQNGMRERERKRGRALYRPRRKSLTCLVVSSQTIE